MGYRVSLLEFFSWVVFGSTDANRHFKPFGIALISTDEDSECFIDLFNSINALALQEFNHPFVINQIMADGAPSKVHIINCIIISCTFP